jgi:hypothetical protein
MGRDFLPLGFDVRFSGTPIFAGRAAFFADRIAAFVALESPSSSSSSLAIFRLFALRESPENLSLLGYEKGSGYALRQ